MRKVKLTIKWNCEVFYEYRDFPSSSLWFSMWSFYYVINLYCREISITSRQTLYLPDGWTLVIWYEKPIFSVVFMQPFLVYCFICNLEIFILSSTSKCHHIIINDCLFKEFFGSEYSSDTTFMHGNVWPDQFETSLKDAIVFLDETLLTCLTLVPYNLVLE